MSLSILCVTKAEPFALPFLAVLASDAFELGAELVIAVDDASTWPVIGTPPTVGEYQVCRVQSAGYIESVLDEAIGFCCGDYVLRLDDDERMSLDMVMWLRSDAYLDADHWAFPRANLWGDADSVLVNPPLWPDLQTRLSIKPKAGGRHGVHDGSPFGTGRIAPAVIEHHKYLIKSREVREAQARGYDALRPGAGTDPAMWPYMVPEVAYARVGLHLAPLGDGDADTINASMPRVLAVTR
jgi:hypothetical protein